MFFNSKLNIQNLKFVIAIFVLLLSTGINHYLSTPDISLSRRSLTEFPRTIGEWETVQEYEIDNRSMKVLQVDDYIVRNYRNAAGDIVGLYIGYFKSQKEGKGIHSPRLCLPGSGWMPVETGLHSVPIKNHPMHEVTVNKYLTRNGLNHQLYLFWYHGRGRAYASEYWNKMYLAWDGLTKRRTDGALIRLNKSGDTEAALKTQTDFINLLFPLLKEYIPD
jgi:EpsI family protein